MIKKILLLFVLTSATFLNLNAQDTTAYELQRSKINALLAERSANFGQYDQSLTTRTGIFGLQTKRDIRNSNEILRQIVLNDNEIFTQLKVLMDYKDLQNQQVQSSANINSESILSYRKTIKQLQDQNQNLTTNQDKVESSRDLAYLLLFMFLVGIGVLAYFFKVQNKKLKQYEEATF